MLLNIIQDHIGTGQGYTGNVFDIIEYFGQFLCRTRRDPGHIVKVTGDVKTFHYPFVIAHLLGEFLVVFWMLQTDGDQCLYIITGQPLVNDGCIAPNQTGSFQLFIRSMTADTDRLTF